MTPSHSMGVYFPPTPRQIYLLNLYVVSVYDVLRYAMLLWIHCYMYMDMHMQLHTVVINVMLICARCLLLLRAALSMYVLHTRVPCSLPRVACAILFSRAWLLPIGTLFSFRFLLIPFSFLASIYFVVKSRPSQWNFPTRSGFVAVLGVPCPGSIPSRTSWLVRVWLLSAAFPCVEFQGW